MAHAHLHTVVTSRRWGRRRDWTICPLLVCYVVHQPVGWYCIRQKWSFQYRLTDARVCLPKGTDVQRLVSRDSAAAGAAAQPAASSSWQLHVQFSIIHLHQRRRRRRTRVWRHCRWPWPCSLCRPWPAAFRADRHCVTHLVRLWRPLATPSASGSPSCRHKPKLHYFDLLPFVVQQVVQQVVLQQIHNILTLSQFTTCHWITWLITS